MAMNKRKNTRSQVWPDTKAFLKITEEYGGRSRSHIKLSGVVQNLGSNGFFLETKEIVPVPAKAEIVIDFDPKSDSPVLKIQATGQTVHRSKGGIGIRFTGIDLNKLQKCIVAKMNKLADDPKYQLKGVE
jgi:hypothetical protein